MYPEYYSMENANGGDNIIPTERKWSAPSHDSHLKEHGGQIYQVTRLENAWIVDEDGKGNLGTKFDTLIGTDENRLFIEANLDKAESNDPKYDVSALTCSLCSLGFASKNKYIFYCDACDHKMHPDGDCLLAEQYHARKRM